MDSNRDRLVLFHADGTLIDAFSAIDTTFSAHGMDIGNLKNFRKRRKLLKYLGGIEQFPDNMRKQFGKQNRKALRATLTEVHREETLLYPGLADLLKPLIAVPDLRIGLVTRNVSIEPAVTLEKLFARHDIDINDLNYLAYVPLAERKTTAFREARARFDSNPARAYTCGD